MFIKTPFTKIKKINGRNCIQHKTSANGKLVQFLTGISWNL